MLKRSHRAINTFAMLKLNNLRLKPGEQQPPSLPQLQTLAKATWNRLNDKDTTDPDDWFDKVKSVLPFAHFESPDPTRERPPNTLRLVCISDTHEREVKNIPDGDVLIHAGDFTLRGSPAKVKEFNDFIARQPHKHKVVIAGNHDLTFDEVNFDELRKEFKLDDDINAKESKALLKDCIYLEDTGVQIDGVIFFGSPHQPEFCGWAFNEPRGDACRRRWSIIPDKVDVLITHGPPLGHGDWCYHGGRAGCVDLLREVQTRIEPKAHVFGHIHESAGVSTDGQTIFANASTCDLRYRANQPPIVIDVPKPEGAQPGVTIWQP
eukprot:TRINITY_DN5868_c0_g1_i3.p1 TRINITY_DN5868_c0_g1~~TRINITY_DN5868_c0_g1_i3.p1  ORF type:complete len:321 (+),score=50.95 TRINITY_DN5868_c0_g1_i3:3-965(+)